MENNPIKHVCGQCNDEWMTEEEYLAHVCPKTGFAPTQPENLGSEFANVQKAALERGLETLRSQGVDTSVQEAAIADLTLGSDVQTIQ